jgi:Zn-dependent peptidase ImmA (M78 family)
MNRVYVKPALLRWARDRAGLSEEALQKTFPKLVEWEAGSSAPTLRQLEIYAQRTWTPFGYFFLAEPPEEKLPIPDFRTVKDSPIRRPSPHLLEMVFTLQRRQAWLRDFLIEEQAEPLAFVGSVSLQSNTDHVAAQMRETLGITPDWARHFGTWTEALLALRDDIEELGVVTTWSGVVGNNTRRKLDVKEFRGFVLSDEYAPLIFVNSADAKAAQMFTLVHELVHIWLGSGGVLNLEALQPSDNCIEEFCNCVAAEFLVPARELEILWVHAQHEMDPYQAIARRFKVSPLVAARRALDLGHISKKQFFDFYSAYMDDDRRIRSSRPSGGDFYRTNDLRLGRPFSEAIAQAVQEGRLLYHNAYQLTGLQGKTFDRFVGRLAGVSE